MRWFERFSESPPDTSASAKMFPSNNHAYFENEYMALQCSSCRTVVVTTLCFYFRKMICQNEKKTEIRAVIRYFVKKGLKAKETHSFIFNCSRVDQRV